MAKTQKKIYIEDIEFFDGLLDLESTIKEKTIPTLIERHIYENILGTDEHVRYYARDLILNGLTRALSDFYYNKSISDSWSKTDADCRELVMLSHSLCLHKKINDNKERVRDSIIRILKSFNKIVEDWLQDNATTVKFDEPNKYSDYCYLAEWISDMTSIYIREYDKEYSPINMFAIVLNGWELFKDKKMTYRFLGDVQSTIDCLPESVQRWKYIEIIKEIYYG